VYPYVFQKKLTFFFLFNQKATLIEKEFVLSLQNIPCNFSFDFPTRYSRYVPRGPRVPHQPKKKKSKILEISGSHGGEHEV
jgi:hypothetical protein